MAFIAEGVARTFARFAPLEAYRLDLFGCSLGIVGVLAARFLRAPAARVGASSQPSAARAAGPRRAPCSQWLALACWSWSLLAASRWRRSVAGRRTTRSRSTAATADALVDRRQRRPAPGDPSRPDGQAPLYTTLYERVPAAPLDDVLIIGAGSGNDVAVALAKGARHVDAVEIDPRLYELGRAATPTSPTTTRGCTCTSTTGAPSSSAPTDATT